MRTLDTLLAMVDLGVIRLGATATASILDDLAGRHEHEGPAAAVRAGAGADDY